VAAVQVEDDGTVMARMGRGVVRMGVQTAAGVLHVVSCHLKSKPITYPGGLFQPVDEGQRSCYTAYALDRRAAEATAVRAFGDRNGQRSKQPHKVHQAQLQQGRVPIEQGHNIKQEGLDIKAIADLIKPCTTPAEACSNHGQRRPGSRSSSS
jgi:hypothetical protein